jgi:hypothetical protein
VVALLAVLRVFPLVWTLVDTPPELMNLAGKLIGDLSIVMFGAAFGLALRRQDVRAFLTDPEMLGAFYLALAFTFASAGVGKAFSMTPMIDFFSQSGYSLGFLKFIIIAEIFGALGMLLPWARIPAWFGLTIDMFGAVLTHVHNGDPLNDSAGAIGLLIRLFALAVLFGLVARSREAQPRISSAVLRATVATVICFGIAFGGSVAVRQANPAITTAVPTK